MARSTSKRALTQRQSAIIALIAEGEMKKAIAPRLGLSVRTIETHTAEIFDKLGAKNSAHAVAIWTRQQCEARVAE